MLQPHNYATITVFIRASLHHNQNQPQLTTRPGSHETSPFLWFGLVAIYTNKNLKNVDCWSAHCYALADGKNFPQQCSLC